MIDVYRLRFGRQAVSDHAGAPRRVRSEHTMIDEQIGPRLRHERRQPSDELDRFAQLDKNHARANQQRPALVSRSAASARRGRTT